MTGPGSLADFIEMWEPIKGFFHGLIVVYHGDKQDPEALYLEANKGNGRVIYFPFSGRYDFSRNAYLYCGPQQTGDWCIVSDVLEHVNPQFAMGLPFFLGNWERQNVNMLYFYGKVLAFRHHESLYYQGFPHEALQRQDGQGRGAEIKDLFQNEADVRENVRPKKRDRFHFVGHYLTYALLPWGSNHYFLGLEGKPNARELFMEREYGRLKFIDLLRELGIPRTKEGVIEYMKRSEWDQRFRAHVAKDKICNDAYRYFVLGRTDFADNHDWNNVISVDIPIISA